MATVRKRRARKGTNCSQRCLTKDHYTFGECMRAKGLRVQPNLMHTGDQKRWDGELDNYKRAVDNGLQPEGTSQAKIDAAWRKAEA